METEEERNCKNNQCYEKSYPDSVNFPVLGYGIVVYRLRIYSIGIAIIMVNAWALLIVAGLISSKVSRAFP